MGKYVDLSGSKFGRLLVLNRHGVIDNKVHWECQCDCGNTKIVYTNLLKSGKTRSCGCLQKEISPIVRITHGMSNKPEYKAWAEMIKRCYNENSKTYRYYGGRGIRVCDRWRNDYNTFYLDMGNRPSPQHSVERVNVDGDYTPENCIWASKEQQSRNRRTPINNTSGTNGVHFYKQSSKWAATINVEKKRIHLGYFETLNEAIIARKKAEQKYWKSS